MFNVNSVVYSGRATRDAELKNVGENSKVATFRLASNRKIKKKNGEVEEKATFIDCEVWQQRAEYASQYIKKGSQVLVQGRLETDEWTTGNGDRRSKIKVYCDNVQVPYDSNRQDKEQEQKQAVGTSSEASEDLPF
jgi:single-strand DNA-binding protein